MRDEIQIVPTLNWKWKALIAIGLAVLAVYAFGCNDAVLAQIKQDHKPTAARLNLAYKEINRDSFDGKLPGATVLFIDLTAHDWMGHLDYNEEAKTWSISIDIDGHPLEKEAEMTLIHEMCHQEDHINNVDEGLDGHNQNHYACMLRVANKGGFKDLW